MIGDVNRAMQVFWSSFGVSAYRQGHAPADAVFPFITYEISSGDAFSTAIVTAFDWHKVESGVDADAQRAAAMDSIAEAIPPQGNRIALERGYLILFRNPADFQTYYDDPEDKSVIGGRTSLEVRFQTY